MPRGLAYAALFGFGVLLAGCPGADPFQCGSNEQCGVGGQCEDNGDCSFVDETCPSGRRWGQLAGDGNAGQCVVDDVVATGGTT
ncbi:MAG: hypothetical protein AAF721_30715, partial [Myxococcota bacterium]